MLVLFGSPWRELGCFGRPWLSFLDLYGAHFVKRCRPGAPGLIKELKEPFQAFLVGVSVCKPSVFIARSAFLVLHTFRTFRTFHTFVVAGSAVETLLLHAPGVTMTVVELTPSNHGEYGCRLPAHVSRIPRWLTCQSAQEAPLVDHEYCLDPRCIPRVPAFQGHMGKTWNYKDVCKEHEFCSSRWRIGVQNHPNIDLPMRPSAAQECHTATGCRPDS